MLNIIRMLYTWLHCEDFFDFFLARNFFGSFVLIPYVKVQSRVKAVCPRYVFARKMEMRMTLLLPLNLRRRNTSLIFARGRWIYNAEYNKMLAFVKSGELWRVQFEMIFQITYSEILRLFAAFFRRYSLKPHRAFPWKTEGNACWGFDE